MQIPWVAPALDTYTLEDSVGFAARPDAMPAGGLPASDAEGLAQQQLRRHPRSKCFLGVELRSESNAGLLIGNLSDVSLGGCCVETNRLRECGTAVVITPLDADGMVCVRGVVVNTRFVEGSATFKIGVQFVAEGPTSSQSLQDFVQYVAEVAAKQRPEVASTYLRWLGGH
jgi:hypothetical protein